MKISIVGTGYVGLVAGVCFADVGHEVICVDNNDEKIKRLKDGQIPIYEPGLGDILKNCHSRIEFTTDIAKAVQSCSVNFIAVGTPEKADGNADLGPTMQVIDSICKYATEKKFIVLKSTVPIGTAKELSAYVAKQTKIPHEIINNPEFLKEGAAVEDFLRPDRVIIGCKTQQAKDIMDELYAPFVKNGHPIYFMSNISAEMTKYAANSFLSVKISFINELAALADTVGADINDVRKGFTSDKRINPAFFYPGVGYGGSCFPKDVQALIHTAKKHNCTMDIVASADSVNDKQKLVLFEKVQKRFGDLKGKHFAMWGLSFKPRTDDVREAPALHLLRALTKAGATVTAYDPVASETAKAYFDVPFTVASSTVEATKNAEALLLVTEWNEFRNPDFAALKQNMKNSIIFDGRNCLNIADVIKNGFEYHCIGRQIAREESTL
ncbi:MAG: UDP-glucose/GDP-mannose dehydrogenase family protein [Bdellovibrionaceae bacterium]|nr:UDP-glucose/GDP-mannose dehydrogenase family protein [Pseudobdellovibrionaceae bacterium]